MICYLLRHGKDGSNVRGGWSNSCLSDEGILQVKNLTKYISEYKDELRIKKLFSSDLPSALQTAKPISELLNIKIKLTPEFCETNNGLLADMPNDIAAKKYPGLHWNTLEWNEPYPQGESPCDFYMRIKTAWTKFTNTISRRDENVILVTHSGVINIIYSLIDEVSFSNKVKAEFIPYAELIPLNNTSGAWKR